MFDLWLNKSRELVDEIVAESNLKDITKKKLDEFMATDTFQEYIQERLENSISTYLSELIEEETNDALDDNSANEIRQKAMAIIYRYLKKNIE